MDFPTRLDLHTIGRDVVLQKAKRIDPVQVDVEGTDANIYVGTASVMTFALVLQLAYAINKLLLDGADGDDLDRYAYDRYGLTRKAASPALGTVRFFRKTTSGGQGEIEVGTNIVTLTGVEYITTTTAVFSASSLTATADVRAVQAGKATQVGKNAIRRFKVVSDIFDQTIELNNDDRTAGGEDAEEDEIFRDRIRDFWNAARRGTLSAIEFGARTVSGVDSARASEAINSFAQPARVVNLFVADSSGVSSAVLGNTVRTTLEDWRAGGIAVLISNSVPQLISVVLKLTFRAGVNTSALTENVRGGVFEFVNSLPVNGPLYRAALMSVLQRYVNDGLVVDEHTVAEPVGDIIPDAGKTLRIQQSDIVIG